MTRCKHPNHLPDWGILPDRFLYRNQPALRIPALAARRLGSENSSFQNNAMISEQFWLFSGLRLLPRRGFWNSDSPPEYPDEVATHQCSYSRKNSKDLR